jgi:hypothetical protein
MKPDILSLKMYHSISFSNDATGGLDGSLYVEEFYGFLSISRNQIYYNDVVSFGDDPDDYINLGDICLTPPVQTQ